MTNTLLGVLIFAILLMCIYFLAIDGVPLLRVLIFAILLTAVYFLATDGVRR